MINIAYSTGEARSTTRFASGILSYSDETVEASFAVSVIYRQGKDIPEVRIQAAHDLVRIDHAQLFLKAENRVIKMLDRMFVNSKNDPLGPSYDPESLMPIAQYINEQGSQIIQTV